MRLLAIVCLPGQLQQALAEIGIDTGFLRALLDHVVVNHRVFHLQLSIVDR
jgi:hypothetical protein